MITELKIPPIETARLPADTRSPLTLRERLSRLYEHTLDLSVRRRIAVLAYLPHKSGIVLVKAFESLGRRLYVALIRISTSFLLDIVERSFRLLLRSTPCNYRPSSLLDLHIRSNHTGS